MEHFTRQLREKRLSGTKHAPVRNAMPTAALPNEPVKWAGLWIFVFVWLGLFILGWIALAWVNSPGAASRAFTFGWGAGLAAAAIYYAAPLLRIAGFAAWHRKLPGRAVLAPFTLGQKFACLCLVAFSVLYAFSHTLPNILYLFRHWRVPPRSLLPYINDQWHFIVIGLAMAAVLAFVFPLLLPKNAPVTAARKTQFKAVSGDDTAHPATSAFGLWLGRSTGHLAGLWHSTGIAPDTDIVLSTEDAAQNVLVLGGIGSGKTTRTMQPLLAQLLDQECGGLLFDVKGDVKNAAVRMAETAGRQIKLIGPDHEPMNLLYGLSPETAASFLKSAFLLGGKSHDPFWTDTAAELCRNSLGVLSFVPGHYSLHGLYLYLFDTEHRLTVEEAASSAAATLSEKEARLLKSYWHYQTHIFDKFDEKVKAGVNATVAQALSPFSHPDLTEAFCQQTPDTLDMRSVLDGAVFLVDVPLARWGLGAKVAYTFIKLRFFNVMQARGQQKDADQTRPVFFMCDEYQELVSANKDGLSDLNFWDKSRSSKTIGIISAQSISSFYAALGDRDLTNALLQNFRQKICFRTEDQPTLAMMDSLAGRAKVMRTTSGRTFGESEIGLINTRANRSDSHSVTEAREAVLDAVLFRNLQPNQAVALLSLGGHSMDDVLEMTPLYVN